MKPFHSVTLTLRQTCLTLLAATSLCVGVGGFSTANAASIVLDADTVATGSTLDTTPLVTAFGTISYSGEIQDPGGADTDFFRQALREMYLTYSTILLRRH